MKKSLYILILLLIKSYPSSFAQTINWAAIDSSKHLITENIGLDYSVSFGFAYGYKLNTKLPTILIANFSIPAGEKSFDDLKTKIGGQICLLNNSKFKASISLLGIYRKYQTPLVQLQNFGSDIKGSFGIFKNRWFFAVELGFDKAIVTHFKHSQKFKDEIYSDVVNGWYEPPTGGNFYYGIQSGFSLKKIDITLNLGRLISQDFKTQAFLPFYFNLGVNYKIL